MLIVNGIKKERGQSLVELLVAMTSFVFIVSVISFLVLDSYLVHRLGREETSAVFLAEEGLEATRSIRDDDWANLADGQHGVTTTGGVWVFQGVEDGFDGFKRQITVETVATNTKKIVSKVNWDFTNNRSQEVVLITYLTYWQKQVQYSDCYGDSTPCTSFLTQGECEDQLGCSWTGSDCQGDAVDCENFLIEDECLAQDGCDWQGSSTSTIFCWGIGGSCDTECQYSDYGSLTSYYSDPGCSDSCPIGGNFYTNPSGACSTDGTGSCYKMESLITGFTSCSQGVVCESSCAGTCTPCEELNFRECNQQDGCSLDMTWPPTFPPDCVGSCTSCSLFPDQSSCEGQEGCYWGETGWYWNLSNFQTGYSSYINCQWYEI